MSEPRHTLRLEKILDTPNVSFGSKADIDAPKIVEESVAECRLGIAAHYAVNFLVTKLNVAGVVFVRHLSPPFFIDHSEPRSEISRPDVREYVEPA